MTTLWLDLETFCETPITHGTHRYAEDAEVLLVAVATDNDPVEVWDTSDQSHWPQHAARLQAYIDQADRVVIHNSAFDRTVLRHGGVVIPPEKVVDTMVIALQHSLPGSLGALCDVLGVPQDKAKDKAGKKLIQLFTKPLGKNRKLRRATSETHPQEWADFIEYARLDVDAMRDVFGRLPTWNCTDSERALWLLDQRTNDRGVRVDLDLARSAIRAFERTTRSLAAATERLTNGEVGSLTQRGKFLEHLSEAHGYNPADLTKGTVSAELKRDDLDPEVRELLEIRQQAAATSPAKYKVLLNATSSDERLRGLIQFCGAARTGRDAGRIFQPQNLPRPSITYARIRMGIDAMKADCEDLLFDNVSELCSSAIRSTLIPAEGKKFVVADLSNIEGRVLAWLAGEGWKLAAFRDYDAGRGPDLYIASYARSFGVDVQVVVDNKKYGDGSMRQIGKILELSMGYQGSVGAFAKMGGAATGLSEDEILALVRAWRKAHPNVVRLWYAAEDAAKQAIRNPGQIFRAGKLYFDFVKGWLRIRLPSGRYLCYPGAKVLGGQCEACGGAGKALVGGFQEDGGVAHYEICRACYGSGNTGDERLVYSGINQYTRKWETIDTYGGKIIEQSTQGTARDIFKHGLVLAEKAGYELVIPVHDEAVTEVPDDPRYTADGLSACLCKNPSWAPDLPLAAAGNEMPRYAKLD